MDPITHAASGALLAHALPERYKPQSKLFVWLAALMAASPDIDVLFATAPINYILLHRGITHSLAAVPFMAVVLALLAFPLWHKVWGKEQGADHTERAPWTFQKTFFLAVVCLLLHIWLDIVTTYGTMIFLPFSEYRVRLNGVFIVDILLTVPLLLAVWHGSEYRPYAVLGLIWLCVYPATCVGIRYYHEAEIRTALQQDSLVQERGALEDLMVFPDALAPWYWRVVYQTQKPYTFTVANAYTPTQEKSRTGYFFPSSQGTVYQQGFTLAGAWHSPLMRYPALHKDFAQSLTEQSRRAHAFLDFLVMPIMEQKAHAPQGESQWGVYDLRFSTLLGAVHEFMAVRNEGNPTFLLEVRRAQQVQGAEASSLPPSAWTSVRLLLAGAGQDSGWQQPEPHIAPEWWHKWVGIIY